eukprot:gene5414-7502_t
MTSLNNELESYLSSQKPLQELVEEIISSAHSKQMLFSTRTDTLHFLELFLQDIKLANAPYCPIVFAGPSGVGKGTLLNMLLAKYPSLFGFSVSHTTRAPREGEENGVHYNFVDKTDMEAGIERGEFLEFARVHSNIYGTSFQAVEKVKSSGKICLLDIDVQGVENVKRSSLECKYIFIAPPSMEELENRLRKRNTETEEKIQLRMANAIAEMEYGSKQGNFDHTLVNNSIEASFEELEINIKTWYPSIKF